MKNGIIIYWCEEDEMSMEIEEIKQILAQNRELLMQYYNVKEIGWLLRQE
jgi:hypothetical protein